MEEKEVKIKVSQLVFECILEKVKQTFTYVSSSNQKDIYFDTYNFHITNLNRGLRLRYDNDNAKKIEFKSLFKNLLAPTDNPWYIEELSFPFPIEHEKYSQFISIFNRLGLEPPQINEQIHSDIQIINLLKSVKITPKITVTKYRQTFTHDNNDYVFDHIAELGYFIEVEVRNGADPLELISDLVRDEKFEFIRNGYNDMLAGEHSFCIPNETKQLLFKINPYWNVTPNEEEYVSNLLKNQ